MRYIPTEEDIEWLRNVLALLHDGATLVYPKAELIYRVDHGNKFLILTNPVQLSASFMSWVTHEQTVEVAKVVGYTVLIET